MILEYFLAALVYHPAFLLKILPQNHHLLATPIFTDSKLAAQLHALIVDAGVSKSLKTTGILLILIYTSNLTKRSVLFLSFLNKYLMEWSR
jgi:hypothetical protein